MGRRLCRERLEYMRKRRRGGKGGLLAQDPPGGGVAGEVPEVRSGSGGVQSPTDSGGTESA